MVRLLKIAEGLRVEQHQAAHALLVDQELDGLEVSCLGSAHGPVWRADREHDLGFLAHYPGLRALHLGVRARSLEPLAHVAGSLRRLALAEPAGKPYVVDVEPIVGCAGLLEFSSAWRGLRYERLSALPQLERLHLTGGGQERVAIAAALPELVELGLAFGSATDLGGLDRLTRLQRLALLRVNKLAGISAVSGCPSLRLLELEKQARVDRLPDLRGASRLEAVVCIGMTGLTDLSGLVASAVRELVLVSCKTPAAALEEIAAHTPALERVVLSLATKAETQAARALFEGKVVPTLNELQLYERRRVPSWVPFSG